MRVLIAVSFLFAFLLVVMPLSEDLRWWRPEFVVLLTIYWCLYSPQYFGLTSALFVGLCQDVLELTPLGFNALNMLVIAYICHLVYQRIINYRLWHQALWVFVLVGIFQLFANWLGGFFGNSSPTPIFLVTAVLSGLLWPLLVVLMRRVLLSFRLV